MKKQFNGFIVLQVLLWGGSYQPVFSEDDGLCFFKFKWQAKQAVNECIRDVADAIKEGHMQKDSRMSLEDYEVVPATIINPYAEPQDQVIVCFFDGNEYRMKRSDDDWTLVRKIMPAYLHG